VYPNSKTAAITPFQHTCHKQAILVPIRIAPSDIDFFAWVFLQRNALAFYKVFAIDTAAWEEYARYRCA
jgi:hypothetical protein